MNTEYISQYISLLKNHGLAVNNLYQVEIFLPDSILYPLEFFKVTKQKQNDVSVELNDDSLFTTVANAAGLGGVVDSVNATMGKVNDVMSATNNIFNEGGSQPEIQVKEDQYTAHRKLSMLCVGAELPFLKQKTKTAFYNNYTHKFVTGVDTDPVNLTFYVDRENTVVDFFTKWQLLINNYFQFWGNEEGFSPEETNRYYGTFAYKKDYEAIELRISLINRSVEGLHEFYTANLIGAFPANIQSLKLNTGGNTELLQLTVTMEYDKVIHEGKKLEQVDPPLPIQGNSDNGALGGIIDTITDFI